MLKQTETTTNEARKQCLHTTSDRLDHWDRTVKRWNLTLGQPGSPREDDRPRNSNDTVTEDYDTTEERNTFNNTRREEISNDVNRTRCTADLDMYAVAAAFKDIRVKSSECSSAITDSLTQLQWRAESGPRNSNNVDRWSAPYNVKFVVAVVDLGLIDGSRSLKMTRSCRVEGMSYSQYCSYPSTLNSCIVVQLLSFYTFLLPSLIFMTADGSFVHAEKQLLKQLKDKNKLSEVKSINITSSPCPMCTVSIIEAFLDQEQKPAINILRIYGRKNTPKWKQSIKNLQLLIHLCFGINVMDRTILVDCVQNKDTQEDLKRSLSVHCNEVHVRMKEVGNALHEIYLAECTHLKKLVAANMPPTNQNKQQVVVQLNQNYKLSFDSQADFLQSFFTYYIVSLRVRTIDEDNKKEDDENNKEDDKKFPHSIKFIYSPSNECTVGLLHHFCQCKANQRPTIFMSEFLGEGADQDDAKCNIRLLAKAFPIEYSLPPIEPSNQEMEIFLNQINS